MVNSKAWLEGMRAGAEGSSNHNPYRGGQDMQSWFDGYKAGQNSKKSGLKDEKT